MLKRDTSDGGTEFAWQFASRDLSNVYLKGSFLLRCLRLWHSASLPHHGLPCEFSAARWQDLF